MRLAIVSTAAANQVWASCSASPVSGLRNRSSLLFSLCDPGSWTSPWSVPVSHDPPPRGGWGGTNPTSWTDPSPLLGVGEGGRNHVTNVPIPTPPGLGVGRQRASVPTVSGGKGEDRRDTNRIVGVDEGGGKDKEHVTEKGPRPGRNRTVEKAVPRKPSRKTVHVESTGWYGKVRNLGAAFQDHRTP